MRGLLLLGLLLSPLPAHAVKVLFTEWEVKNWAGGRFCAIGAFEDRPDLRVELCAEQQGTQVKALWFKLGDASFRTPSSALSDLPEIRIEDALISKEPCAAALAMVSGQAPKRPTPTCYTIQIPTRQDARSLVTIEFEDQRFISVHAPGQDGLGR